MFHRFSAIVCAAVLFVGSASLVSADHHEAGEVEMAVRQFYGQLTVGQYEEALSHVKLGANGYVEKGVLATMESEEIREMVVSDMEEDKENGAEISLRPEYIHVAVHGKIAIATYLVDATIKEPGHDDDESQVNRGTLVWENTDDGWKIVHWHVSKLANDDD
jgi:hypothetical protein